MSFSNLFRVHHVSSRQMVKFCVCEESHVNKLDVFQEYVSDLYVKAEKKLNFNDEGHKKNHHDASHEWCRVQCGI